MNYNISSRLALPAVGFGLMFFSGCLAGCILGSDIAGILVIAALAVTLVSMIFRRGRVWVVGLLLGLAVGASTFAGFARRWLRQARQDRKPSGFNKH